uniref:Uncharacterized protein n=1 Tax=Daphnia magna TaxID=35525 RepID=A0A0P6ISY6_9CRUS
MPRYIRYILEHEEPEYYWFICLVTKTIYADSYQNDRDPLGHTATLLKPFPKYPNTFEATENANPILLQSLHFRLHRNSQ